jgi:quercetin dioxygenase-like cupin family protein
MKHLSLIVILAWLVSPRTLLGQNQAEAPDISSASSPSDSHAIKITRAGSQPSTDAPADHFTGSVKIELLFNDLSRAIGTSVTFEPGARTAWHTHPFGQTLFVTSGTGWIQQWGEPIVEIRKGDVIWIPAGTKHWHEATPTSSMTHVAITEQLNGNAVTWLEIVSDEQYRNR